MGLSRLLLGRMLRLAAIGLAALTLCGCFGASAIHHSRAKYNDAIQTTNNEELLLNLVRLRYAENPGFLPITALTAQFELDAGATYRYGMDRGPNISNYGEGQLSFADRPTITFAPQRSPELTKGLLTRISLDTLYLFVGNGEELDRLLLLFVRNINGIDNASSGGGPTPPCPPEFVEFHYLVKLISDLAKQGMLMLAVENREFDVPDAVPLDAINAADLVKIKAAGFGLRSLGEKKGYVLTQTKPVRVLRIQPDAVATPEMQELARVLRLVPLQTSYEVEETVENQFRPMAADVLRTKITITIRTVLEVMYLLSQSVCVPPEHVCAGLVAMTQNPDGTCFDWNQVLGNLLQICAAKHKPKTAYIAVKYRGWWFYVDDADVSSKITLGLFSDLFRLQRIGAAEGQPLLTLPVGR